jgi:sugar phosphate isomerase/epimerase
LIDGLRSICDAAAQAGLNVALENVPTSVVDSGERLVEIIRRTSRTNLGACYDVANGNMVEDPAKGLLAVGAELRIVHLSDCTKANWRHDPIGQGSIGFAAIFDAIEQLRFDGLTIVETIHEGDFVSGVRTDIERLKAAGLPGFW